MLSGDNGVLQRATDASEKTDKQQIIEEAQIDIMALKTSKLGDDISEEELEELLSPKYGTLSTEEKRTIDKKLTTKNEKYVIPVSSIYNGELQPAIPTVGNTLEVGDYVKYQGNGSFVVSAEKAGITSSNSSRTGYTFDREGNITFTPENVTWRVFEKKNDGTINIVPERPVNKLYISGKNGFVNAIEIIESICDIYTNDSLNIKSENVRSLKLDDVANDRVSNLKELFNSGLSEFERNYGSYYENNPYTSGTFYIEPDGMTLNKNGYQASASNPIKIKNTVGTTYTAVDWNQIRK